MRTVVIDNHNAIEEIIKKGQICFVGMIDKDGLPYVLPMNYGYENEVIYLHSAPDGNLVSVIENNPNVCITFCTEPDLVWQHEEVACSYRMRTDSVICHGQVVFEEDYDEKVKALDIIMRQYSERDFSYSGPAVRNVKIWKVSINKITAKGFGVPSEKAMIL